MKFLAAMLCLAWATFALTANAQVKIFVNSTAEDPVGKRLDFVLRDKLRGSNSYSLTYDSEEATVKISLVTLDPLDNGNEQAMTIYSFNILLSNSNGFDYFYTNFVGVCGKDNLSSCANSLAQEIGVAIEDIRKALLATAAKN